MDGMLELFAIVRERILARRNPDRFIREFAELAVMTDKEIDEFERELTNRKEKNR